MSSKTFGRESMLLALTWAAGSVDAISYLGLGHVFTAMMTGNTVLLGLALAEGEALAALRSILALFGFGAGVFAGAIIVERESKQSDWPTPVTAALAFETVILAVFSVAYYSSEPTRGGAMTYFLISLLSFAMGIQSAAVRRLGVPGIATTYITGTITSLMTDLLGWLRWLGVPPPAGKTGSGIEKTSFAPWDQRVGLLAGVVSLYCLGALAGGLLQRHSALLVSLLPTAALILVVSNALIHQRHQRRSPM